MKLTIINILLSIIFLSSCNGTDSKDQTAGTEAAQTESTVVTEKTTTDSVSIKPLVTAYLGIKNALAKDDSKAAANAGKEMVKAMELFDKAALSPDQAKTYSDIEEDAKEHAEHISTKAGDLHHQREHFETLSQDVYDLVKTFGAGQKLYHDHCPMYNENKGAAWISETKEIQNPYLGKEMLTCGVVKEELK